MKIDRPMVRVSDAPGYEDFEGRLFGYMVNIDGIRIAFVMDEDEELHPFDAKYIKEL